MTAFVAQLIDLHGRPQAIRCDNGPELTSQTFTDWCTADWLERYNEIRPHDALGSLPPARYRERLLAAETPV